MSQNFARHNKLFEYTFDEKSTPEQTAATFRNAFAEGFTCFLCRFKFNRRKFVDRLALRPEVHDESDAYELGIVAFMRFTNSLQECITKA